MSTNSPIGRFKHGLYGTKIYGVWRGMKSRCGNPNCPEFKNYGGRGIAVCERWAKDVRNFVEDMGYPPNGEWIERVDVNGNYEPGNCIWLNKVAQQSNRRNNRWIAFRGETLTLSQWSRKVGLGPSKIALRLAVGWSVEDALLKPVISTADGRKVKLLSCAICGANFQTNAPNGKFCSLACIRVESRDSRRIRYNSDPDYRFRRLAHRTNGGSE